jgi:hypothetical protein
MPVRISISLGSAIFLAACSSDLEGKTQGNQAPETAVVVDTIIRSGDDRLESRVDIRWWGDDPDGYVTGYEYTFETPVTAATAWTFIRSQDSVFLLQTPPGQDTADFTFSVRAIDDEGAVDPTPAQATYPVKNSPPSVRFQVGDDDPSLSFPIVKFFWEGDDPDESDNLGSYELYWNDTTAIPYIVDASAFSATFVAVDAFAGGESEAEVFLNTSTTAELDRISGMRIGAWNNLYIRAVDQSAAKSGFVCSDSVYIRPVRSNVLLVNGYSGGSGPVFDFYVDQLSTLGITSYDTLTLFDASEPQQVASDNLTQTRIFDYWDLIVWFGNNAQSSLSLAQKTTSDFFDDGGKMLMAVYVSSSFDEQSDFLDFTPIAELVTPEDTTLLLDFGADIIATESGWPNLQGTSIVGVVRPLIAQIGAQPLYEASLTARDDATLSLNPWNGESVIMALKEDASGTPNFVLSTLELQRLDGLSTIDAFFDKVIVDEFGF